MANHSKKISAPRVRLRTYTDEDLNLIERAYSAAARENFYEYRKQINPGLIEGWWQKMVAVELQNFYDDWKAGLAPVLVLEAPPQHGKSSQVIDFVGWASGHDPDTKTIYASYSDDLGLVANIQLQRTMDGEAYHRIFPGTRLNETNVVTVSSRPKRNSSFFEFVGRKGSFRNTTVRGSITGMGLRLGIIDDPIKGREEASSPTIRDKTWMWFTDDFFSRFSEDAALLMMMTRWHIDDPVGRFRERFPHARVLSYPALGRWNDDGVWVMDENKATSTALFPELKSKRFLLKRKKTMFIGSWMSLYQQSPIVVGGDLFPIEKIEIIDAMPSSENILRTARYWDKAGTEGGTGAATAGVRMHHMRNGTFIVDDVVDGHWSALRREMRIKQVAKLDNAEDFIETYVEQEPGSGGKESAESTIRNLAGYKIEADRVSGKGSKEIRAQPFASQVQAGNVKVLRGPWNKGFLDELEMFPNGKRKDKVDAASGAFIKMTVRESTYDTSLSWVEEDSDEDDDYEDEDEQHG